MQARDAAVGEIEAGEVATAVAADETLVDVADDSDDDEDDEEEDDEAATELDAELAPSAEVDE